MNTWRHNLAVGYLVFAVPLLVLIPVGQAMQRWHTWERVAWAVLALCGVAAYLYTRDPRNDRG